MENKPSFTQSIGAGAMGPMPRLTEEEARAERDRLDEARKRRAPAVVDENGFFRVERAGHK